MYFLPPGYILPRLNAVIAHAYSTLPSDTTRILTEAHRTAEHRSDMFRQEWRNRTVGLLKASVVTVGEPAVNVRCTDEDCSCSPERNMQYESVPGCSITHKENKSSLTVLNSHLVT